MQKQKHRLPITSSDKKIAIIDKNGKSYRKKGRKGYNYGEGSSNQPVSGSR